MHKYPGLLIYKTVDDLGEIAVVDDAVYRSLHFGSEPKQSSMLLRDPLYLALTYTRAMAATLLFNTAPKRILLLGLGGGSLAKFLLHYLPDCHIDAVEMRQRVVDVAHSHFKLPDEPRLHVHIGDAGSFVRHGGQEPYDLILIDAFLGDGIARTVCGISFFETCRQFMSENGIFGMNLWNGDFITAREMREDIENSFEGNALHLPVEGKANTVVIAANGPSLKKRLRGLRDTAAALERQTGLEYGALLKQLIKHSRWFFH
jgi:spermidine synthase